MFVDIDALEQLASRPADGPVQIPRADHHYDDVTVNALLISEDTVQSRVDPDLEDRVRKGVTRILKPVGICTSARSHSFSDSDNRMCLKVEIMIQEDQFPNITKLFAQTIELHEEHGLRAVHPDTPKTGPRFKVQTDSASLPMLEIGRYSDLLVNKAWAAYRGTRMEEAPPHQAFFEGTILPGLLQGLTCASWITTQRRSAPKACILLRHRQDLHIIHSRFYQEVQGWCSPSPPSPDSSGIGAPLSRLIINTCWVRMDPHFREQIYAFAGARRPYDHQHAALCVGTVGSSVYNTLGAALTLLESITTLPARHFGISHFSVVPSSTNTVIDLRFGCDGQQDTTFKQADAAVSFITRLSARHPLPPAHHIEMKFDVSRNQRLRRCPYC